jgi:hypothetical protein
MRNKFLVVAIIGVLMAAGVILTSCDGLSSLMTGETKKCSSNGNCRVMTNQNSDGAYEFCGDSDCAVGKVPYPVPPNTNASCDC